MIACCSHVACEQLPVAHMYPVASHSFYTHSTVSLSGAVVGVEAESAERVISPPERIIGHHICKHFDMHLTYVEVLVIF